MKANGRLVRILIGTIKKFKKIFFVFYRFRYLRTNLENMHYKLSVFKIFHILFFLGICTLFISCSKKDSDFRPDPGNQNPPPPPPPTNTKKWIISTIAGQQYPGNIDGYVSEARFNSPEGLRFDGQGNLYIADMRNRTIRKINADSSVTTIAGPFSSSSDDFIYDIIFDNSGNLISAEGSFFRKVFSKDSSTILAGSTDWGYLDGTGPDAKFSAFVSISKDQQGNFVLPDVERSPSGTQKLRLRKVTSAGVVTTIPLQDNTGIADFEDSYFAPLFITSDLFGNFYYSARGNSVIKKINLQGVVTLFAGGDHAGLQNGTGAQALFYAIAGLTSDANGNIWVSDFGNHAIRKITLDGTVTTIIGAGQGDQDGDSSSAKLYGPAGITTDKNGVIYVSDVNANKIKKIEYK